MRKESGVNKAPTPPQDYGNPHLIAHDSGKRELVDLLEVQGDRASILVRGSIVATVARERLVKFHKSLVLPVK